MIGWLVSRCFLLMIGLCWVFGIISVWWLLILIGRVELWFGLISRCVLDLYLVGSRKVLRMMIIIVLRVVSLNLCW